MIEIKMKLY